MELADRLKARDIMTPHIKSVPQHWTLQRFAAFLSENGISGSPVVDDSGEVIGIATLTDIADFHWNTVERSPETDMTEEERQEARRLKQFIFEEMQRVPVEVSDIMCPILFSVDENDSVRQVARLMMEEHLHRVFVRRDGKLTGIITTFDMLKVVSGELDAGTSQRDTPTSSPSL
ncbi:CBS domain-containing protein [Hahella sp. SMD15-11]|uniref:CBS domain-containing protein n=1 Tax=Thermohahella caldifontis TaxID=3142973 RepID=A0AB39V0F3_9GAMM